MVNQYFGNSQFHYVDFTPYYLRKKIFKRRVFGKMAVEILSSTYEQDTRKKLIDDDCPRFLLLIFNFAFLPMIQDITREMDAEFK